MLSRQIPPFILGALIVLVPLGCDSGLAPETALVPPHGLSGTIYFSHWPPADSLKDLRLVAFRNYPSGNIVSEILSGNARYTDTLKPFGTDSIRYTLNLEPLPPGSYHYIAVAQQYGMNLYTDWRVVGLYRDRADTTRPGTVVVPEGETVKGIDIMVDFRKVIPPP